MKKISIIVPVYNAEKTLKKCVTSLVNQTYKNIEIILVNDGSTDQSFDIIKKYKDQHPDKIVVIDQKNQGIGSARNNGIAISTGEYLAFVDSDDYVELDMYQQLSDKIDSTNADVAICDFYIFNDKMRKIEKIGKDIKFDTNILKKPKIINKISYGPCNKLFHRSLFSDIYFPENLKYEDLNTILKVISKSKKITKVNKPLYNYLINENGETQTVDERVFDIFDILNDIIKYFSQSNDLIKKEVQELCISKLFVYNQIIINQRLYFQKEFYEKTKKFINSNFCHWKTNYIKQHKGLRSFLLRLIQTNDIIYNQYVKIKHL